MAAVKLFQYAIIWTPTEKQVKEEGKKPEVLVPITSILVSDQNTALMTAAMAIPEGKRLEIDQIDIVIRPF